MIKILPNEPIKLQLEFNNENGTYWKVIIPVQYHLKEWGDADKRLQELHKLGITKRVNITLKERDRAIEEYVKRYPRKGIPAPRMKDYWKECENYKNYIDKRSDTLSENQVRQIRALNQNGLDS